MLSLGIILGCAFTEMVGMKQHFIVIFFILTYPYSEARRENTPCAYSFHVWNPGNDIVQKVKDVDNKVENITGHVDREFLKMKVAVLQELKQCQNWTFHLEREISDLKVKSLRGRIIERDTSNSMSDVERDMMDLRKKVSHLKHNYQRLQKNYQDWLKSNAAGKTEQITSSSDLLEVLENAVRDLKAEWVVLKRDVIQLQMEQREVKLGQNHRSNSSFHLSSSIKLLSSRILKLEKTKTNVTTTLKVLSDLDKQCRVDIQTLQTLDNKRLKLTQSLSNDVASINDNIENLTKDLQLLKDDNRFLKELVIKSTKSTNTNKKDNGRRNLFIGIPKDCHDVMEMGYDVSGVYQILPGGATDMDNVYCEFLNGTAYTVIQRRTDGLMSFNRQWVEYKFGFGNLYGSHWIGNEWIYHLTNQDKYTLRIDIWDWEGRKHYAEYVIFNVGSQEQDYELHVGGYTGNAGDSLSFHDGMKFSTEDMDNDLNVRHCAAENKSGWWFNNCYLSNLNGVYHVGYYSHTQYSDGIVWYTLKEDEKYSLRKVEMKIRRNTF